MKRGAIRVVTKIKSNPGGPGSCAVSGPPLREEQKLSRPGGLRESASCVPRMSQSDENRRMLKKYFIFSSAEKSRSIFALFVLE